MKDRAYDWPALFLALVALTFLLAAATADGQELTPEWCESWGLPEEQCELWAEADEPSVLTAELKAGTAGCPDLSEQCAHWSDALQCPYPGPLVTPAMESEMAALTGPWVPSRPDHVPPRMQQSYGSVLNWWRDARSIPARDAIIAQYCREGTPCGRGFTAWEAMGLVLKPCSGCGGQPCWSWTGDHAKSQQAYVSLYGGEPTLAQWLQIECHHRTGGSRWGTDQVLPRVDLCVQSGGDPEPDPDPDPDPQPPPPPPPPPPECEPYAGSDCEEQCIAGRKRWGSPTTWTKEWCLSPDRDSARGIGAKCVSVCREGEPDDPDPDPEPELECWEGKATGRFVPGEPSTGEMEVRMFAVDCPEEGSP